MTNFYLRDDDDNLLSVVHAAFPYPGGAAEQFALSIGPVPATSSSDVPPDRVVLSREAAAALRDYLARELAEPFHPNGVPNA